MERKARLLLRDKQVKGDPAHLPSAEEAPDRPRGAECLERKSTGKINIAIRKGDGSVNIQKNLIQGSG
ncbi:hypothetical protein [Neobacillus drentensis]|uniref:hypothetical protein n=1 Tax=Neobacillus drentensis TaxID=220684 RepID=UPI003000678A